MRISDDGKGFRSEPSAVADGLSLKDYDVESYPPANTGGSDNYGGNGILSMKKHAAEMNGEFSIVSEIGKGTETILKLPWGAKNNVAQTTQAGGDISARIIYKL